MTLRGLVFATFALAGAAAHAAPPTVELRVSRCLDDKQSARGVAVVQRCHSAALGRDASLAGAVRVVLAREGSGPFHVGDFETEGFKDEALLQCIRSGIDELKLASSCASPEGGLTLALKAPRTGAKTLSDDAAAMCSAADQLLRAGAAGRPDVLRRLAVAFTDTQPSPSGLAIMDKLATVPKAQIAATWIAELEHRKVANSECAPLRALLSAPSR